MTDVRFGVYLTIEEMAAAARVLAAYHGDCDDGCQARSAATHLRAAAARAKEAHRG